MDIFATVCAFDPQGQEMTFIAAPEPKSPVTQGWLRVSQRKLDPQRSTEYLPTKRFIETRGFRPDIGLDGMPLDPRHPVYSRTR